MLQCHEGRCSCAAPTPQVTLLLKRLIPSQHPLLPAPEWPLPLSPLPQKDSGLNCVVLLNYGCCDMKTLSSCCGCTSLLSGSYCCLVSSLLWCHQGWRYCTSRMLQVTLPVMQRVPSQHGPPPVQWLRPLFPPLLPPKDSGYRCTASLNHGYGEMPLWSYGYASLVYSSCCFLQHNLLVSGCLSC